VARLTLDYSIKFYRQSKGIFKVNVAAADVRRIPIGGSRREDTMIAGLMSARPDVGAGLERCGLGAIRAWSGAKDAICARAEAQKTTPSGSKSDVPAAPALLGPLNPQSRQPIKTGADKV